MRRGFGFVGLLVTIILLTIVGVVAYNVGWSDGLSTHVPQGTAVAPPFLFIVFAFFALLRFAFFGRRHWGGGWGSKGGYGHGMPSPIDERMQEWHKRAHGEQPSGSDATPPPPPDQRSV